MKPAWQSCSISPPTPPPPLASRALPSSLTPARSGFPERRPGRPRTATLGAPPPPSGWRWVGRGPRAASRFCFPALLPLPLWPPPPRPSDRGWGALRPPGGPPAAVPETRAGGGARPSRPHRPPRPSGRSPLTSANFWGPLGGSEGTRARAPGSPRPGWASRLLVGAPGHPPGAARARWRGVSLPPCTPLQVNAEAKSSCHHSRSPSGLLSLGLIRAA